MLYVSKEANAAGNHGNPKSKHFNGSVSLPDSLLPNYLATMGFANLTVSKGKITAVEANEEAIAAFEENSENIISLPSTEETVIELLADHEERICMIEIMTM